MPKKLLPHVCVAILVNSVLIGFCFGTQVRSEMSVKMPTEVSCEIKVSNTTSVVQASKKADPLQFSSLDLPRGFRFSMQFLKDGNKLKTYVYQTLKERHVLSHLGELTIAADICSQKIPSLGLHRVYSSGIEFELIFQCKPVCAL
jgi:hypothetical protein